MKSIVGSGDRALKGFVQDLSEGAMTYNRPPHLSVIDFVLASPGMASLYVPKSYRILGGEERKSASDHYPVVIQFDLSGGSSAKAE